MMDRQTSLRLYQELADRFDRLRDAGKRDLFLVLAAEAALSLGLSEVAERLLHKLLAVSPHNLLKPYSSLAEAMRSPDVQFYVEDLKRQFPPEKAEQALQELEDREAPAPEPLAPEVYPLRNEPPRPAPSAPKPAAARPPGSPYNYAKPQTRPPVRDEGDGSWFTWLLIIVVAAAALALGWHVFLGPLL